MTAAPAVSGLLVIDKPGGWTSHDVVAKIRGLLGIKKVGHAGTLDPMATGVLLVGVGRATRLLSFLQALPKEYRAQAKLGVSTSTQDAEGEVVQERPCTCDLAQLREAAGAFTGEIRQLPPMMSAVKVRGEPLYKAARRGEEVERRERTVRVYRLEVESFDPPVATIYVKCSSGTYVRTLAADIGDSLGCGAHLVGLRRLAVGSFGEEQAIDPGEAAADRVMSMREAMRDFPVRTVRDSELDAVVHGRELAPSEPPRRLGELPVMATRRAGDRPAHEAGMTAGIPVAILEPGGELIAVYRKSPTGLKPAAVLV